MEYLSLMTVYSIEYNIAKGRTQIRLLTNEIQATETLPPQTNYLQLTPAQAKGITGQYTCYGKQFEVEASVLWSKLTVIRDYTVLWLDVLIAAV